MKDAYDTKTVKIKGKINFRSCGCTVDFTQGPGALLAKIEYDGILGNPQSLMCKKRQITYRYFMFC